jgi:hypothetical protein
MSMVSEVLSILPKAEEQGFINKEEKLKIKEMLMDDENYIVKDYLEEYGSTKDQSKLLENLRSYVRDIASDDEKQCTSDVAQLNSPEDFTLMRAKKHMLANKQKSSKKQPDTFADNVASCEEGLSPTIVFTKKK